MRAKVQTGVAYFGCHHLAHAREDFATIAESCDWIVLTMSEADLRWSRGTIRQLVGAAHNAGLEVWLDPWGVGGVFGGEALSAFVGEFPEECQITNQEQRLPRACPCSPRFRSLLHSWIAAAAETEADGIFWDEPHFWTGAWAGDPDHWACWCPRCLNRFVQTTGRSMFSSNRTAIERWQATAVCDLLADVTAAAHAHGLQNAVCLLPAPEQTFHWFDIARLRYVDEVGTDPYWFAHHQADRHDYVTEWTDRLLTATRGLDTPAHLWIQGCKVPKGGHVQIPEMIDLAYEHGIRRFAAWGFNGCGSMSSIACAEPELVWATIVDSFQRIKAREG
jgi:hypothetical protein